MRGISSKLRTLLVKGGGPGYPEFSGVFFSSLSAKGQILHGLSLKTADWNRSRGFGINSLVVSCSCANSWMSHNPWIFALLRTETKKVFSKCILLPQLRDTIHISKMKWEAKKGKKWKIEMKYKNKNRKQEEKGKTWRNGWVGDWRLNQFLMCQGPATWARDNPLICCVFPR